MHSREPKKTGQQCKQWAIPGGTVSRCHGGNAPQVRRKAGERLKALVDPAIVALERMLQPEAPEASQSSSAMVALGRQLISRRMADL
jgi:hypothetical protein